MGKNLNYTEMLRHENELAKLKIQAEFGMKFGGGDVEINPAIENIWLNQILEYERAMVDNKKITIGELLGNPSFKHVSEISDDDIATELQSLMELLMRKNIVVDTTYGIDDREMYRFITQELFLTETNSCFPKNMILGFIYEEFHPNDEGDIRRFSMEFVNSLCNKDETFFENYLSTNSDADESEVKFSNLKRRLHLFRDAFDEIRKEKFDLHSVIIKEKTAEVDFSFSLAVLPPGNKSFQFLSGNGKFFFVNEFEYWSIEGMEMKGVV